MDEIILKILAFIFGIPLGIFALLVIIGIFGEICGAFDFHKNGRDCVGICNCSIFKIDLGRLICTKCLSPKFSKCCNAYIRIKDETYVCALCDNPQIVNVIEESK